MVDLHVHSTFSDGSLTPAQLAEGARAAGLTALALTDHDTTAGVAPFLAACAGGPLRGIAGVEISAEFGDDGTMHILGYCMDCANRQLEDALAQIRGGREARNTRILEALNRLGIGVTMEDVRACAGEDFVGRPHFARAMLNRGYVGSTREAFDRFLGKGQPAYVDRFRLSPEDSVRLIRRAGGVPSLAHPGTLNLPHNRLRTFLDRMVEAGLMAMECYYSEHPPADQERYLRLAEERGLLATGGSDFHGLVNPDIGLGVGFGHLRVPDETVDGLLAAAARSAAAANNPA